MRLIDADELLTHIEDYGEGQSRLDLIDPYYVRNAPTVDAISRKQIDKMISEIEECSVEDYIYHGCGGDQKIVELDDVRRIINKYAKEQTDGNDK